MGKSKGQMKSRLSYSAGAFGNDVFYATLSTYFIMFVTTHLFNTGDPKQNSHYVLLITNIIAILRILEANNAVSYRRLINFNTSSLPDCKGI